MCMWGYQPVLIWTCFFRKGLKISLGVSTKAHKGHKEFC
ncbi:hypothetical protein SLEP1_g48067 [Rubroshorea leprosula]|uniref:Uncharacterized protein n=1 Tax=Rubroshorea leprosula TaxID=152421 RepID=A0AAV5LSH3_9ROSI|nr:hypothetical protein SLEP1_g48067 [Rubroshorea leprosula]